MQAIKYWASKERVHVRHGWSGRTDLVMHNNTNGSNVLAISGPAGVGKSDLISKIISRNSGRFVGVKKDSLRLPKELEKCGKIPYNHISFWDIVDCDEPQLCSMNVGLCLEPKPEWLYWMKSMKLSERGVMIPEPEEMVACADYFINRYLIREARSQQQKSLKHEQILLLEISYDLETDFAEIFPAMSVIRLYCKRQTRVDRIICRDKPNTRLEWVMASLKILDSLSFPPWVAPSVMSYYEKRNQTRTDSEKILLWVERLWGSASARSQQ